MAAKQKTIYCCTECGNETPNWAGKCPACGAWNTLTEVKLEAAGAKSRAVRPGRAAPAAKKKKIKDAAKKKPHSAKKRSGYAG